MIIKYLKIIKVFSFFTYIFISQANEKICVLSIPKSGTHLLEQILFHMTTQKAQDPNDYMILEQKNFNLPANYFLQTHAFAIDHNIQLLAHNNFKGIFLYRDPRDQIVSYAYYIKKYPAYWPHIKHLSISQLISLLTENMGCIYGAPGINSMYLKNIGTIDNFYKIYLRWAVVPNIYSTSFEKLVGSKGGGSDEDQLNELINIALHCSIKISINKIEEISQKIFGSSITYRQGMIGAWKNHFSLAQKNRFKKIAGQLLIDLGYEKDLNW